MSSGNYPGAMGPGPGGPHSGPGPFGTGAVPPRPGQPPVPAPAPAFAGSGPQPGAGSPVSAGPAGPTGTSGGRKRLPLVLSLVAVGIVVVLVVVGIFTVNSVNRSNYGPDAVAVEYLEALEAGDIAKVNDMAPLTVPNGASEELLDAKYLTNATERITDVRVLDTTVNGDTATIDAQYTLGGQEFPLPLSATKDGRTGVFFDNWTLQGPVLPTVSLSLPFVEGVTLNGEEFVPREGTTQYALVPGSYSLATPGGKYWLEAEDTISVGFPDTPAPEPISLTVTPPPTDTYTADVQKAVESALTECAKQKNVVNEGCPFTAEGEDQGLTTTEDVPDGSVEFSIDSQPTVEAELSADLAAGSFRTTTAGEYSWTGESKEHDNQRLWKGSGPLDPSGSVFIENDTVRVEFW
ncbi:hypothetical protein [Brevibacterium samyangense]|uniref:Uncharacterized protein n=1 Tax=Brevibacterium samyangense TaxID=366888 RepID=A0ABN2TQA8_9MICO